MEGSKVCSKCNIDKPLSSYHKYNRSIDGRQNYCKPCKKHWGKVNRPQINERLRYNYATDPKVRAQQAARRAMYRIVNLPDNTHRL
jgi:hypothetical protein